MLSCAYCTSFVLPYDFEEPCMSKHPVATVYKYSYNAMIEHEEVLVAYHMWL